MKKLSEYKDDEALELLADLIVPVSTVFGDAEVREASKKESQAKAISIAIKKYKKEIIEILAKLDGVPVEEYHISLMTLPVKLLEVLNDEELKTFFSSQSQNIAQQSFGSATENTSEKA